MYYYLSGEGFISDKYKGRLEPHPSPGPSKNVSVILRNMQVADSGLYTCEVRNVPDVYGTTEAVINVNVIRKLNRNKAQCFSHWVLKTKTKKNTKHEKVRYCKSQTLEQSISVSVCTCLCVCLSACCSDFSSCAHTLDVGGAERLGLLAPSEMSNWELGHQSPLVNTWH